MTVNLTINDISAKEAMELLQLAQTFSACTEKAETVKKPTEALKDVAKAVNEPTSNASEPKAETAEESTKEPEPTKYKFTIEEVRSAFANYAKANSKDKAKEMLKRFNATKVTEIKEEDYGAVLTAIKEG